MKEMELRALATCQHCGRKIGQCGAPMFYKLAITRYMVDLGAVRRQAGLEKVLGDCAPLAQAMGPDEDLAKSIGPERAVMVCHDCACEEMALGKVLFE